MFQDSLHTDYWYFFAVTGINITQKLVHSLKKGVFDSTLLSVMETEKGFDPSDLLTSGVFDYWYFIVFQSFNSKWKQARPGIMAFN